MNIQNVGIFTGNCTIFAGNRNQDANQVEERKQFLNKRAMKVVLDTNKGVAKVDDDLDERRAHMKELQDRVKDANSEINRLDELTQQSKEAHNVADDSPEQKKLEELLKLRRGDSWTENEWKQIGDLGDLTEYQREALMNDNLAGEFREQRSEGLAGIKMDSEVIHAVNKARLKDLGMIKAEKMKDSMEQAASKEIIGMLGQEAVEHIDEEMDKVQEAAQEKAEQKQETEKKQEQAKLKQEEMELELEKKQSVSQEVKQSGEPVQEMDAKTLDEVQKNDISLDKIDAQLKQIIQEEKLLEEELKGMVLDTVG